MARARGMHPAKFKPEFAKNMKEIKNLVTIFDRDEEDVKAGKPDFNNVFKNNGPGVYHITTGGYGVVDQLNFVGPDLKFEWNDNKDYFDDWDYLCEGRSKKSYMDEFCGHEWQEGAFYVYVVEEGWDVYVLWDGN